MLTDVIVLPFRLGQCIPDSNGCTYILLWELLWNSPQRKMSMTNYSATCEPPYLADVVGFEIICFCFNIESANNRSENKETRINLWKYNTSFRFVWELCSWQILFIPPRVISVGVETPQRAMRAKLEWGFPSKEIPGRYKKPFSVTGLTQTSFLPSVPHQTEQAHDDDTSGAVSEIHLTSETHRRIVQSQQWEGAASVGEIAFTSHRSQQISDDSQVEVDRLSQLIQT